MSELDRNLPMDSRSQEAAETSKMQQALTGLSKLPVSRQVGLMLGLALSVAIGVAVVLWSQAPAYDLLFASVAEKDSAEILDTLTKMGVDYKVETGSGAIMVPADKVREMKLKLAAQGLPRSASLGYELLDKDNGFGASKSVEQMRFQRALEGEIALTIQTIQNVKAAKVLLAIPVQSVFVRERKKPSASVVVELYQGRTLEKEQIESIIHLVASSVPLMEASQVTVVDQKGRLLNSKEAGEDITLSGKQFEYKKNIEEHLRERIENILTPLVGGDGMRAQISADVDFTVTEKTQEMFNPDLPALRSEQTQEETNSSSKVQGVPGALSNQPPPTGVAPEVASGQEKTAAGESGAASKSATRNYELDKTITHTRLATGALRRLSVAVVVDDKKLVQTDGKVTQQPYSQEDLNQLRDLVKQAVGYDNSRGDQVTVTNVAFKLPDALEELPSEPIWDQPWFASAMKQLGAVLVVLLLIMGVLRPVFKGLITKEEQLLALEEARAIAEATGGVVRFDEEGRPVAVPVEVDRETGEIHALPSAMEDLLLLEAPQSYEKRLEYVQKMIDEDPKLVAQVIKTWLKDDG
ncbi:flagellar basal-body MS-ring/collar protein FliF [Methylomonas sp. EFPC3]|uniref:flagellar basal-body MS-ring/collar protein FliF n=1 Tax=Methylomonas sp. EFPC3 TaxID=3021710 RepID=UPI002415C9A5|nr:flagellar basal-body MS-ring/collar protein FliF [Methylomonas sp. EFPC3]WFP50917.1 flagellar basal-body MS-ring/collar protein FliF [Methylomonas sp. EFPC3]